MMIFIGGASNQPNEMLERWYPMHYTSAEAEVDSCGDGQFRGGFGIDRSFETTEDIILTMHGDRVEVTPFGLAGGHNGGANLLVLNPGTADEQQLGMDTAGLHVPRGTRVLYCSNGGGGFGPPCERDVERVLDDLRTGFIDRDIAEAAYGVVVDDAGAVDEERTRAARRAPGHGATRPRPGAGPGPPGGRERAPGAMSAAAGEPVTVVPSTTTRCSARRCAGCCRPSRACASSAWPRAGRRASPAPASTSPRSS